MYQQIGGLWSHVSSEKTRSQNLRPRRDSGLADKINPTPLGRKLAAGSGDLLGVIEVGEGVNRLLVGESTHL